MRHFNPILSLLSLVLLFLMSTCQQEELNLQDEKSGIQFSLLSGAIPAPENGRINEDVPTVDPGMCNLEYAAYAKVEINGEDTYTVKIQQWEDSYKTNQLELDPGTYEVTKFVVYNDEEEALFATPTTESKFEKFVNAALPMQFTIENYQTLEYQVEVLCVENFSPPEFGFAFWNIDLKQTKQLCIIANYCDPAEGHKVAPIHAYVFPDKEENPEDLIYESSSDGAGDLLCLRMPFDSDVDLEEQNYWVVVMINDHKYAGWIDLAMVDYINEEHGFLHLNKNCEGDYGPFKKKFTVTISNIFEPTPFFLAGVFNTPVGKDAPGPAFPGDSYEFKFWAAPGHLLSTATMYVQSNDLIFTTPANGLELFHPDGTPISGDITSEFGFYDAGTEVNQEPGVGPDQAPRQDEFDQGADENGVVTPISEVVDGYTYPEVSEVIQVTITPGDGNMFTLTIENISGSLSLPSPISPGAWVVHTDDVQLFTPGEAASEGLEDIAEDGNASTLGELLASSSGLFTPISPGAFAVHSGDVMPIFMEGEPAPDNGLEEIAEDGKPGVMNEYLSTAEGVSMHGIIGPDPLGPVPPGHSISFSFYADGGSYLNFVTMFIQSNDYFYAFDDMGLALFDDTGNPMTGEVTEYVSIWDAGTEVDQFPGAGPDQAPRQGGADTGADENGNVILASEDGHELPAVNEGIQVIIE